MTATPKQTPLYALHLRLGARMAPFGGYMMPIQYEGIFSEHNAARSGAVLFDTCHMGEFRISGPAAVADLERLVTCRVEDIPVGSCRYGLMCNPEGGTIDDLLLYREAPDSLMMVVNAGTQEGDFAWIREHVAQRTRCENISADTAKIDLQGPISPTVLDRLMPGTSEGLRYFRFCHARWQGVRVCVSRTGYTGERGYEIYLPPALATAFWEQAMAQGAVPAGLGARDTLRLEAGLPLYGHELTATRKAVHTAIPRALALDKPFIGAEALRSPDAAARTLAGLQLEGRRAAREGDRVTDPDGHPAGEITSGSFSPSLGVAIALATLDRPLAAPGTSLAIHTSRKTLACKVVSLPFYTQGTVRTP